MLGNGIHDVADLLAGVKNVLNNVTHNGLELVGRTGSSTLNTVVRLLTGATNGVAHLAPKVLDGLVHDVNRVVIGADILGNDALDDVAGATQKIETSGTNLLSNIGNQLVNVLAPPPIVAAKLVQKKNGS